MNIQEVSYHSMKPCRESSRKERARDNRKYYLCTSITKTVQIKKPQRSNNPGNMSQWTGTHRYNRQGLSSSRERVNNAVGE